MFLPRLIAQLGILAAVAVLAGSLSVLLHGRESRQPLQQAQELIPFETLPQVVFGDASTLAHR